MNVHKLYTGEVVEITNDDVTVKLDDGQFVAIPRAGSTGDGDLEVGDRTTVYLAPISEKS